MLSVFCVASCSETDRSEELALGAAMLDIAAKARRSSLPVNPFVAYEYKPSRQIYQDSEVLVLPTNSIDGGLAELLITSADLRQSEIHWKCRTETSDGETANIELRLIAGGIGYVGHEPIQWSVTSGDSLNIIVPDRGVIRWRDLRFAENGGLPTRMGAVDSKSEMSVCDRSYQP